jgi:hypothetical protein
MAKIASVAFKSRRRVNLENSVTGFIRVSNRILAEFPEKGKKAGQQMSEIIKFLTGNRRRLFSH